MIEIVLDTHTLPEPIVQMIHSKQVKIRESDGDFVITPIREDSEVCPLFGMFSDGKISTEKFHAQKQEEKKLELCWIR